jgi:hypothetical protein
LKEIQEWTQEWEAIHAWKWRKIPGSKGRIEYYPARPDKSAETVEKLMSDWRSWLFDCGFFTEAALLLAFKRAWAEGARKRSWKTFDQKFAGKVALRQQGSKPLGKRIAVKPKTHNFKRIWEAAPVGTKVQWRNDSPSVPEGSAYKHEFAVKRFKHPTDWRKDRYSAHPLTYDGTESEITFNLASRGRFGRVLPSWQANPHGSGGQSAVIKGYRKRWIVRNYLAMAVFPRPA